MKIYTKTGDQGETSLLGGKRVKKYHIQIEAYGTIDELKSYIGLIRDTAENVSIKADLLLIQERLFRAEAIVASDSVEGQADLPPLTTEDISWLEKQIDLMSEKLPPLTSFILPGGNPLISLCHVARCVCRRSERRVLQAADEISIPIEISKYLNRLSDYLFSLARHFHAILSIREIKWKEVRQ